MKKAYATLDVVVVVPRFRVNPLVMVEHGDGRIVLEHYQRVERLAANRKLATVHHFLQRQKRVSFALSLLLAQREQPVADAQCGRLAGGGEFLEGDTAFGLEADIDDGHVLFDGRDEAPDDLAFSRMSVREGLFEKRREIVAGWIGL